MLSPKSSTIKKLAIAFCFAGACAARADWFVACESSLGGSPGIARLKNSGEFKEMIGAQLQSQPLSLVFGSEDVFTVADYSQTNSPLRRYFADGTVESVPTSPSFHPGFIFLLPDQSLIVTEYFGGPIYHFSSGGTYIGVWSNTSLQRQTMIADDEDGKIYVGGFRDTTFVRLDQNGSYIDNFPDINTSPLTAPGGLVWLNGLAYVSESGLDSVNVLNSNGTLVSTFGLPGLSQPATATVDNGTLLIPGSRTLNICRFGADGSFLNTFATLLSTPIQIVKGPDVEQPIDFALKRGRITGGDLQSLVSIDNNSLRICRFIVPNSVVPPIELEVSGHSNTVQPSLLAVCVNSRMVTGGAFQQKVAWIDSSGTVSPVSQRSDILGTTLLSARVYAQNPTNFVKSDGTIKIVISIKSIGPTAVASWCGEFDRVAFTIANN